MGLRLTYSMRISLGCPSPHESQEEMDNIITSAAVNGFTVKEIGLPDFVLAVAHFSSQTVGEDGISQSIIVKSLPIIGPILTHIFNVSLSSGIFPSSWRKAHLVSLKELQYRRLSLTFDQ